MTFGPVADKREVHGFFWSASFFPGANLQEMRKLPADLHDGSLYFQASGKKHQPAHLNTMGTCASMYSSSKESSKNL